MKTRIIVDSTADLMPEYKERVKVVPLTVHFGDEEYVDGVTIDHKTFYEKLVETDVHPSTSQASPAAFEAEFEEAKQAGESAVVITLSSKLSGTYQSAVIAAQDYENIYIVDSESVAIGGGILVELALKLQWMYFVYALPVVLIIRLVFNSIWFNPRHNYFIISALMWSVLTAIYTTFLYFKINVALIYLLGVAGQIVIVLWSFIKKPKIK